MSSPGLWCENSCLQASIIPKHQLKAEEYRARAEAASAAADSATLARVREQHHQAARTWSELAQAEAARSESRRAVGRPALARPQRLDGLAAAEPDPAA